jgi:hypothetical protein
MPWYDMRCSNNSDKQREIDYVPTHGEILA